MNKFILALFVASAVNALCNHQSCMLCGAGDTCEICNTELNYASDGQGGCNVVYIQFCIWKDENGLCHVCEDGWVPVLGSCKRAPATADQCLRYGCDDRCAVCESGFYPDPATGECTAIDRAALIQGCTVYTKPGQCQECSDGFFSVGSACVALPSNCIAPSPIDCNTCPPNSFPINSQLDPIAVDFWEKWIRYQLYGVFDIAFPTCVANVDPNCLVALSATQCEICTPGYFVNAAGLCELPIPPIPFCEIYQSATICERCQLGYFVDANGQCVQNIRLTENCRYYDSPTRCIRCYAPYYLVPIVGGTGDYTQCVLGSNNVANCDWYIDADTCQYCESNFYIENNTCLPLEFAVDFCAVYDINACLFCLTDYYLVSPTECARVQNPIPGCYRYADETTCLECDAGFSLVGGLCVSFAVEFCSIYNEDGTCLFCQNLYYLVTPNQCGPATAPGIPFCEYYASATTCARCVDNYNLVNDMCEQVIPPNCDVASSANQCEYCMPPFYYNAADNTCVRVPAAQTICDCARYVDATTCILCGNSKFLNTATGQCEDPTVTIDHCYSYASPTTCGRCLAGKYVSTDGSACVEIPNGTTDICGCDVFTSPTQCLECQAGKFLNAAGQCEELPDYVANCRSYQDNACIHCDGDRYLANPLECVLVVSPVLNCFQYDVNGVCIYCDEGFIINAQGTCDAFDVRILNCRTYSARGVCEICEDGFYLENNLCIEVNPPSVPFCARYSDAVTCSQCQPGYYLENNLCLAFGIIANCKYASGLNSCAICNPDFYLENGACVQSVPAIDNCAEYSGNGVCDVCETNFYLDANECLPIARPIDNCLRYLDLYNCAVCDDQTFPIEVNGYVICQLVVNTIANCLVYLDANTCRYCQNYDPIERLISATPLPYFALTSDGLQCIENCETADTTCTRCAPGFFPSGPNCTAVPNAQLIDNCVYYSGPNVCEECQLGYELVANQCILRTNPNICPVPFTQIVTCEICNTGFVADDNGDCQPVTPALALEGCLLYQPGSGTTTAAGLSAACAVCDSRHFQIAEDGACTPISPLIFPPTGPNLFEELICAWKSQR